MRDETQLPPLDFIMLTAIRSLAAKRPCFHDTGDRARELRDLAHDRDEDFDADLQIRPDAIEPQMAKVASKSMRAYLPLEKTAHDEMLKRLMIAGWVVVGPNGYKYQHSLPAPDPEPTPAPEAA